MTRRRLSLAAAVVAAALLPAAPAAADHHFMRVGEVFGGAEGNPDAQFVELRMFAAGQRFVNGASMRFLTPTGAADGQFFFTADVANGTDNATVLVATQQAADFFGVTPDLLMTPVMDRAGGKLEFVGKTAIVDRFSWGSYSGVHTGSGTPYPGGLPLGQSVVRDVSGGVLPSELEAADDTGDSANDFNAAIPSPTNNANQTTSRATVVARSESTGEILVDAADGVANAITISGPVNEMWKIAETGAPVVLDSSAAASCFNISITEVQCPSSAPSVAIDLGDRDDRVTISGPLASEIAGGTGNDKLTGGGRRDVMSGDDGHDTLTGNNGNDQMIGGPGNEVFNGGNGADDFEGGIGIDTATYATRTGGLVISMDGNPDDGNSFDASGGRRDNVATDIEWLTGGKGPDRLTGSAGGNRITGGGGADQVFGNGGADNIFVKGDGAADSVDCGSQVDQVSYDAELDLVAPNCETATP